MISPKSPMTTPAVVAGLALVATVFSMGCAVRGAPIGLKLSNQTSFDRDWQRYARVKTSKAFALAGDPTGLCVTGLAYGMSSRVEAEARALDYCEEQRIALSVVPPCVIFAVDDERVHTSAGGQPPSVLRSGRDLSALF